MQSDNVTNDKDKLAAQSADAVKPAQTKQNDDVDETVERQDEYNKFNKGTVQPQPQIQQSK